jgi:hypothetical protein
MTTGNHLAIMARRLAAKHRAKLKQLKSEHAQLKRPDFLWHYLLQSFATMGRASGWRGLIGNKANYNKLRFETLVKLSPKARRVQVEETSHAAKIRMPSIKAKYILNCFKQVRELGGLKAAKTKLLAQSGRERKIAFLKSFSGIGDKYARNIMMDVYHPEFRDSIAVDARIKSISDGLGLHFHSYQAHENFYLNVAREAGLNGWELDRLMFSFQNEFLSGAV